jgi:hypothetical protein
VLQDDGETLEFGELRRYLLRRPDKLRIDSQRRVGGARVVYFDGAKLTVSSPDQNAYAFVKLKQHRDVDDAVEIFRDRLGMPVPLGELLVSEPVKEIDDVYDSGLRRRGAARRRRLRPRRGAQRGQRDRGLDREGRRPRAARASPT